ncbi:hypothetical protein LXL04_017843 [Taraxacum kok-saghyz]
MGEEVRISDYDVSGGDDDDRVSEWEAGLPNVDDLPSLSQLLISAEMASAFSITAAPHRSMVDVDRASRDTVSSLQGQSQQHQVNKLTDSKSFSDDRDEEMVVEGEETFDLTPDGSDSRKLRRVDSGGASGGAVEDAHSAMRADDTSTKTLKRIRLVWTPQLHKRFVEVVAHLGLKKAVPKTIMQMMNVEGLSRENVASHLQKYRLYVKRMHGSSNEAPSSSDPLFASPTVPKSSRNSVSGGGTVNPHSHVPIPMPYQPQMVPLPYPPPQMVPNQPGGYHHGFDPHSHPYSMMMQPRDCQIEVEDLHFLKWKRGEVYGVIWEKCMKKST